MPLPALDGPQGSTAQAGLSSPAAGQRDISCYELDSRPTEPEAFCRRAVMPEPRKGLTTRSPGRELAKIQREASAVR
jgi:hypothetical protein